MPVFCILMEDSKRRGSLVDVRWLKGYLIGFRNVSSV